jgi:tetratricopeptide (TPR) repeat protein
MMTAQIVIFIFSFLLICTAIYFHNMCSNGLAGITMILAVVLTVFGALYPQITGHSRELSREKGMSKVQPTKEQADKAAAAEHNKKAIVLHKQGKLEEAAGEYLKAVELDDSLTSAHYNLGALLYGMGRLKEAEQQYRKVIKLDPKFVAVHNSLGAVLYGQNNLDEAEHHFRKAVELDTQDGLAFNNLGQVLADTGRAKEAERMFMKAFEIYTNSLGSEHPKTKEVLKNIERLKRE